ncbi:hypothetical protein HDV06_006390 [Boothiomyces sp. JEL0866]|nr:hypothetical protein HDV06_006390 [Boothiomyces sp. JEL0866]
MNNWNIHLPYKVTGNAEWLQEIKQGLAASVQASNMNYALDWLSVLKDYYSLKNEIDLESRIWLAQLLYSLITCDTLNVDIAVRFIEDFLYFTRNKEKLPTSAMELDYLPLYKFIKTLLKPKRPVPPSRQNHLKSLIKLARSTNRFFKSSTANDILQKVLPAMNLNNFQSWTTNLALIVIFIPTEKLPELPQDIDSKDVQQFYWMPILFSFLTKVNNCSDHDMLLFDIFARLSRDQLFDPTTIGWKCEIMEYIFTVGMKNLGLPVGSGSSGLESLPIQRKNGTGSDGVIEYPSDLFNGFITSKIHSFARIIVYTIFEETAKIQTNTLELLESMLRAIETFAQPSNVGKWSASIARLISDIAEILFERIREESKEDSKIPQQYRLTDSTVKGITKSLITLVELTMFSKNPMSVNISHNAMRYIAWMNPHDFFPILLEKVYPSLETLTETHRTSSSLGSLYNTSTALFRTKHYPSGGKNLIPLLDLCLLGLDINDLSKSITTLLFISSTISGIPLFDATKESAPLDITLAAEFNEKDTEELEECRLSSVQFEAWLVSFTDRIFALLENLPQNYAVINSSKPTEEEGMINMLMFTCDIVFNQLSGQLEDVVSNMIFKKISNTVLPNASKIVGNICAVLLKNNIAKRLKLFVPLCIQKMKEEIDDGAGSLPHGNKYSSNSHPFGYATMSDSTFHWYQIILNGVVNRAGVHILDYLDDLEELLDLMLAKCNSYTAYSWAADLLSNLLTSLSSVWISEYRSHNNDIWNGESFSSNSYARWGEQCPLNDVKSSWHVPNAAEVEKATKLFTKYSSLALTSIGTLKNELQLNPKKSTSQELSKWLTVLNACIVASITLIQPEKTMNHNNEDINLKLYAPQRYYYPVDAGFVFTDPKSAEYQYVKAQKEAIEKGLIDLLQYFVVHSEDVDNIRLAIECVDSLLGYIGQYEYAGSIANYIKSFTKAGKDKKVKNRFYYLKKIYSLHTLRIAHTLKNAPTTKNVQLLLQILVDLSVSKFTEVRKRAQTTLFNCLKLHRLMRFQIYEKIVEILNEGVINEKNSDKVKGAIYLLRNRTSILGVFIYNWKFTAIFCETLMKLYKEDKPSILEMVRKLFLDFVEYFGQPEFENESGQSALQNSQLSVNLEYLVDSYKALESERIEVAIQSYHKVVRFLISSLTNSATTWRFTSMAACILDLILSPKFAIPKELVSVLFTKINDDHPALRADCNLLLAHIIDILKERSGKQGTNNILKIKKEITKASPEYISLKNEIYDYRLDSKERVFFDKVDQGWLYYPDKFEVYSGEVDSIAFEDLESKDAQQLLIENLLGESFWKEFMKYASLEAGQIEQFAAFAATLYKKIFSLVQSEGLELVLPILNEFVSKSDKSSQRTAAELLAGIIRGSKHWNTDRKLKLETEIFPVLLKGIQKSTTETIHFWGRALEYIFKNRDPRRLAFMLDKVINVPLDPTNQSFFAECRKLWLIEGVMRLYSFRMPSVSEKLANAFVSMIGTHYQQIREALGSCIDATLRLQNHSVHPDFHSFVLSESKSWKAYPSAQLPESSPIITKIFERLDATKTIPVAANNSSSEYASTILSWMANSITSYQVNSILAYLPSLALRLVEMQEYAEPELNSMAVQVCKVFPNFIESPLCVTLVLKALMQRCQHIDEKEKNSWYAKIRILPIIQILFFRHLHLLSSAQKQELIEFLCNLIQDPQLEVRKLCSVTLSGIIRCSERRSINQLKDTFINMLTETKLPKRKKGEKPPESYSLLVTKRHAAILGLSSLVLAFPYDVPEWMPSVLVLLAQCANDPSPISTSITLTFGEFKRTHQDSWDYHKSKFNEQELYTVSDLLYSPGYYA